MLAVAGARYGYGIYEHLRSHVEAATGRRGADGSAGSLDTRLFHLLVEHKQMLADRIERVGAAGSDVERFAAVRQAARSLNLSVIAAVAFRRPTPSGQLLAKIDELAELEYRACREWLAGQGAARRLQVPGND